MKQLIQFSLLAIVALGFACSQNKYIDGYKIELTIRNVPDSTLVTLSHQVDSEEVIVDSTIVLAESAILVGKIIDFPERYSINIDGNQRNISLFLENAEIKINAQADSLSNAKISGSDLNDRYNDFVNSQSEIRVQMRSLFPQYDEAEAINDSVKMAELDSLYALLEKQIDALSLNFISSNSNNILGPYQALRNYYFDNSLADLDSVMNLFNPNLRESNYVKRLQSQLDIWNKLKIGMEAPIFIQNDSSGQVISLDKFRGKYLFVDFWASWCGPCRSENPNIVAAYAHFKDKGFDILSVSLDDSREKWIAAITKDQLFWNHVSDLNGWDNEVSKSYGIRAIPYSLLLDPNGIIIGKNLRGDKLQEALTDALN